MQFFYHLLLFIFGLIVGSFLNSVIYRLKQHKSLWGYSFCPHCRHRLYAYDLIPIWSYFRLHGACRYCGEKISRRYPLIEFITGAIFVVVGWNFSFSYAFPFSWESLDFFLRLVFASLLIIIFFFDLSHYLISDGCVFIGIVLAFFYRLILPEFSLIDGVIGAMFTGGFFGFLYLISSGKWIGFGDVKLGFFLGLFFGFTQSIVMLMIAYISGALVGVLMVLMHRKSLKGILPFGTFLALSSLVTLIWGEKLLDWYLGNFYF